jgi:uncharacterized protein
MRSTTTTGLMTEPVREAPAPAIPPVLALLVVCTVAAFSAFALVDRRPTREVAVDGSAISQAANLLTPTPTRPPVSVRQAAPARAEVDAGTAALIAAAESQVGVTTSYDPTYVKLAFPGGDVPLNTGVCTDVIVRAYRGIGIDLQVAVNEDMRANFSKYPKSWGLKRPDPNIDHRRALNLERYFQRQGGKLVVSDVESHYQPGDLVSWSVGGRPHIGLVSNQRVDSADRFLIIHNVGSGARIEDVLFAWPITAHHRWIPEPR